MIRFLILCGLLVTGLIASEIEPLFDRAHPGALLEWRLVDPDPEWDGIDVRRSPVLEITDPEGAVWRRPAFRYQAWHASGTVEEAEYEPDGAPELRIRHTARVYGVHSWRFLTTEGEVLAEGTMRVAGRPERPFGVIRHHPDNPWLLAHSDGSVFIPCGINVAWALGPHRIDNFLRYTDRLAANGGNHFRLWLTSWQAQFRSNQPGVYRLDQAWVLDRMLAAARDEHLRVTVVLDNFHDLVKGSAFPYGAGGNRRDRERAFFGMPLNEDYVRDLAYVMARWGCDDSIMAWELFNELDFALTPRQWSYDDVQAWVAAASTALRELDQDGRMVTVSFMRPNWVSDRPSIFEPMDMIQFHDYLLPMDGDPAWAPAYRDGVRRLIDLAERGYASGKPFRFSEVGHQGGNQRNPGNSLDGEGILLRRQYWAGFFLGGYGSGMNWWWDVYVDEEDLWPLLRGLPRVCERIDWSDGALRPLQPNDDQRLRVLGWVSADQALVWPHLVADTWHAAATQDQPRPRPQEPVGFQLHDMRPNTPFNVEVCDLVSGAIKQRFATISDDRGVLPLQLPTGAIDVALVVRRR